jgi:hypothetical protein
MPVDWSQVTVEHVRRACDLYDAGAAVPKRSAKSTFLSYNGKTYPAKFIRGLAYHVATGIELDPNKDFTGGDETVRFFASLGLGTSGSAATTKPATPASAPGVTAATPSPTPRKLEPQKHALLDLLTRRFKKVECEAQFSWLVVPKPKDTGEPLTAIFAALQEMRGFSDFASSGRSLRCDFFIPQERLLVEYDERQHFTLQRAKSLELYPAGISWGFDRKEWIKTCNSIRATDPSPPYRDEQRAFYDSLRDILADRNGYRVVRIRQGDFDWTGEGAEEKLTSATIRPVPVSASPHSVKKESTEFRKIALVAHDYNVPDSRGLYDYSEHFARINKLCDDQGCDTILYALHTWDSRSSVARTHDAIFGGLQQVQRVVLEVGQPTESFEHVEVWVRGRPEPILASQKFASSKSSFADKYAFVADLPSRRIGDALLVLCGETNIVKLKRATKTFEDEFGFCDRVKESKTRLILNPIHDYMKRPEMRKQRKFYSQDGRTVISVWNKGKGKEAWLPWTVFHDGEEWTDQVLELDTPFGERPDIRIGLVNLDQQ